MSRPVASLRRVTLNVSVCPGSPSLLSLTAEIAGAWSMTASKSASRRSFFVFSSPASSVSTPMTYSPVGPPSSQLHVSSTSSPVARKPTVCVSLQMTSPSSSACARTVKLDWSSEP